jgi:hypothetical protein
VKRSVVSWLGALILAVTGFSPFTQTATVLAGTPLARQALPLDPASAPAVAQQVANTLNTQDWSAHCNIAWSTVQGGQTQAEFAQTLSDAGANSTPKPVSVALTRPGSVTDTAYGTDVYTQPLAVQALDAHGNTTTVSATLYLVAENRQWRFGSAIPQS